MCAALHAPSAPPTDGEATGTINLDHVGISVRDLPRAVEFYTEAFDLTEEFRFTVEEAAMSAVVLRSSCGWAIELLHRPDSTTPEHHSSPNDAVLSQGYGHVCLRVSDDLDAVYGRFIAAGGTDVVTPQSSPHPQVRFSYAADPEGNLVEMVQFLPGFGQ